jgi:pimeloyl-ACP methyl ester carboxylesterase
LSAEALDILDKPQPPPDERVAYGTDPNQFVEVRLPHAPGPHSALLNIHGGFWRAKYDLTHAGHLCEALRAEGVATFNAEYRRIGNPGGGWPGTFEDIRSAYRFLQQERARFHLDLDRFVVTGHSAGGQLALCLASHEPPLKLVNGSFTAGKTKQFRRNSAATMQPRKRRQENRSSCWRSRTPAISTSSIPRRKRSRRLQTRY